MNNSKQSNEERPTFWQSMSMGHGTAVDKQNNRRFTRWCIAWAISMLGVSWVLSFYGELIPSPLAWLLALSPNIVALMALTAYLRYLRMADEMQRRIQIEGLAIGFGTGWIFAIGYVVLQAAGAPPLPATLIVLVMTVGWVVGTMVAVRHYQ